MSWADLLEGDRRQAFVALTKLSEQMWGSPETTGEVPPIDQRISVSITKDPKLGLIPCIHVDRIDSVAFEKAKGILEEFPFVTKRLGGGEAQSAYHSETRKLPKHATTGQLLPGAAISHGRYRFGTLGCIVEAKINDVIVKCAVTAAHVASLSREVELGESMYCPGKGSVRYLKRGDVFGKLAEAIDLYPLNPKIRGDVSDDDDVSIEADIALIEVTDERTRRLPTETLVPDPNEPNGKPMKISAVLPEAQLGDVLDSPVYLFGAVSGFSTGTLTDIGINRKILKLPNRKNYAYHDLLAIAPGSDGAFSRPGDSGSIIYTNQGLCVGFLVGADDKISFACIGDRALAAFDARIV